MLGSRPKSRVRGLRSVQRAADRGRLSDPQRHHDVWRRRLTAARTGHGGLRPVRTRRSGEPDGARDPGRGGGELAAYRALRRQEVRRRAGIVRGSDSDDLDDDPARQSAGRGAPRAARCWAASGWRPRPRRYRVVDRQPAGGGPTAACAAGVGPALVRAACAYAESNNVLRFEAAVQARHEPMFAHLGWTAVAAETEIGGCPHVRMRWPIDRIEQLAAATKAMLGAGARRAAIAR